MENILLFLLKLGNSFLSSHHPPPPAPPPPVFLHLFFSPKKNPEKLLSRPELLSRHATASPTTSHLSRPFSDKETFHAISLKLPPKKCDEKILAFFIFPLVRENKGRKNGARAKVFSDFFISFSARFPTTIKCFRHSRGSLFDSLSSSLFFPFLFLVHWFLAI